MHWLCNGTFCTLEPSAHPIRHVRQKLEFQNLLQETCKTLSFCLVTSCSKFTNNVLVGSIVTNSHVLQRDGELASQYADYVDYIHQCTQGKDISNAFKHGTG